MNNLAPSFFIGSSSFLQVSRTCMNDSFIPSGSSVKDNQSVVAHVGRIETLHLR